MRTWGGECPSTIQHQLKTLEQSDSTVQLLHQLPPEGPLGSKAELSLRAIVTSSVGRSRLLSLAVKSLCLSVSATSVSSWNLASSVAIDRQRLAMGGSAAENATYRMASIEAGFERAAVQPAASVAAWVAVEGAGAHRRGLDRFGGWRCLPLQAQRLEAHLSAPPQRGRTRRCAVEYLSTPHCRVRPASLRLRPVQLELHGGAPRHLRVHICI